jgi:hypothetical protein
MRFQSFRVSRFQSEGASLLSENKGFNVSMFQGFKVGKNAEATAMTTKP